MLTEIPLLQQLLLEVCLNETVLQSSLGVTLAPIKEENCQVLIIFGNMGEAV